MVGNYNMRTLLLKLKIGKGVLWSEKSPKCMSTIFLGFHTQGHLLFSNTNQKKKTDPTWKITI